jgi:uncharacterized membrane protein YkoI
MKRRFVGVGVGMLSLAVMAVAGVTVTPTMKDLPSAVRVAAEKAIAGGSLKRVVVEKEDGQVAYSVEAMMGGNTKEFTFATDGTLLAEEEDVAFAKLPEAVRAAAEKYFGGSRELRASIENAKSVTSYEITGRKGGKSVAVRFSAQGALLEEEEDGD